MNPRETHRKRSSQPTANTVLTLDVSGSMTHSITGFDQLREPKIEVLKKAAGLLIEHKRRCLPQDRVGAVLFGSQASVLFKLAAPGSPWLLKRVQGMRIAGSTNMEAGLSLAMSLLRPSHPRFLRNIVLLSDGMPDRRTRLIPLAQEARKLRINIHTVGFGESHSDFDEVLLKSIAQTTHRGQYQHCHTLQGLADTLIRFS